MTQPRCAGFAVDWRLQHESRANYSSVDGWEVAKHARELDPEFPVIYMSGDSASDWGSKGVPNSIMLSKPFAPAQLLTAVSQLLNSGTPTA
jgi:CheY-like chemotaxis protein